MAQSLDLQMLSDRLAAAAKRVAQSPTPLHVEVTPMELVIVAASADGGHGQGRTESVPFGVLFHDKEDRLDQALARLERFCSENPQAVTTA